MKIGDYYMRLSGGTQYGPIFGRGGQGGVFEIEVFDVPGGGIQWNVAVETKNSEDSLWTALVSFAAITTTGLKSANATGILEMLRYTFSVSAGGVQSPYDTFYANVLSPIWRP